MGLFEVEAEAGVYDLARHRHFSVVPFVDVYINRCRQDMFVLEDVCATKAVACTGFLTRIAFIYFSSLCGRRKRGEEDGTILDVVVCVVGFCLI